MCRSLNAACFSLALVCTLALGATSNSLPTLATKWSVPIPSGTQVALVDGDIIFFSSQGQAGAEYNNLIQAVTAQNQTLWTSASAGTTASLTTAWAFPSVPEYIFLAANNLQPPNVSAVIGTTGEVVWSTATVFDATDGGHLTASVDGSTIYFSAISSSGAPRLTAIDSKSGAILFAEGEIAPLHIAAQCGPLGEGCLVWASGSEVWFLNGRAGDPLGGVALPTEDSVLEFTVVTPNLVLATTETELFMLNTTNYTVAWFRRVAVGTVSQLQLLANALVLADTTGLVALDAVTGGVMWNSTAKIICPQSDPIPGLAGSLATGQYRLGPLLPGESTFLYTVVCVYGNQTLDVFGWINVADGAVPRMRYLSWFPGAAPTPIGSSYFMLLYNDHRSNQTSEYFLTSHPWVFTVYPPWSYGCTPSTFIPPVVRASDVIFTLTCDVLLVTAITIVPS